MAIAEFFMVYIECREGVSYDDLKTKMDLCRSWYRLNEKMWIIHTTSDVEKLYRRFSSLVKESGSLFICHLDIENRQGWMNKKFWDWLKNKNSNS